MNQELEALVLAYDAAKEKPHDERLASLFDSRLDDAAHRSGVSREKLKAVIHLQHLRWVHTQSKPSSLPPKA
jgi:hypothetical protein